ncbi:MAG: hypothetical protein Q7U21_00425 [Lutibacter sp.]|nr:hypothetical protein [Lutibacter sp.]
MNLKNLLFASVIVLSANASFAQDTKVAAHSLTINIPQSALLDLEVETGTTDVTLAGTAPKEAGLPMTFEDATAKNATIWMNYSSIVKGVLLRKVTVAITNGTVPTGLKLTVLASAASSDGKGTLGAASTALTLTGTGQDIVTGIGSTYTGDGANKGRSLTYQLGYATDAATDYAALRYVDTAAPLTITYTLSDI